MNLILVFGGKSLEHDISVITAKQIYEIAKINHSVKLVYLDKNDMYFLCDCKDFVIKDFPNNIKLVPIFFKNKIMYKESFFGLKKMFDIDCAIMCCHGGNGENGAVVSQLNLWDIPVTAGSHAALSIAMDKWLTKSCLNGLGIKTIKGMLFTKYQDKKSIVQAIKNNIGYPAIAKPCQGGSSIGIEVAKNKKELEFAIDVAFNFDDKILVEKAIENYEEYNCAVLGNSKEVIVSEIDKPVKKEEILSFKDKYMQKNKKGGMKNLKRSFEIEENLKSEIQEISKRIFKEIGFVGVIRIDYIFDTKNHELYVNEINAVPGSLAIYLFNRASINSVEYIDKLINFSIEEYKKSQEINRNYDTNLLKMQ